MLGQVGTSVQQTVETQLYEPDLNTFYDIDTVWGDRMPVPPTRSSMGVKGLIVPGAVFAPNFVVLVPDDKHQKAESRKGIAWHPGQRKVNFSPTITAGGLFSAIAGIVAYNVFVTRVDNFNYMMDEASYEAVQLLSASTSDRK